MRIINNEKLALDKRVKIDSDIMSAMQRGVDANIASQRLTEDQLRVARLLAARQKLPALANVAVHLTAEETGTALELLQVAQATDEGYRRRGNPHYSLSITNATPAMEALANFADDAHKLLPS